MNKGWAKKPLAELCEVFADGDWIESKDQSSEGIRLVQTGNIGDGVFKDRTEKARYISEATFKRLRCTEIVEGDCLISRLPEPVGRSCILPDTGERVITAVDCTIVRFQPEQMLPEFFKLYSQSTDYLGAVAKECTGTTRRRISRSNLGLIPIPVPPLAEQQRIVGLLDGVFAGLATAHAHAEKNLQNARALFESHLQSTFTQSGNGWVEKRLRELSHINYGYTESASAEEVGPKFLRITDIQNNSVNWRTVPYCQIDPTNLQKYQLTEGDIVFARTGATTGKSYLVKNPPNAVFASYLIRLRLNVRDLLPDFVNLVFQTRTYWDSIRLGVSGSAQGGFNATKLGELAIRFPQSLKEQQIIVAKLDALAAETQRLERIYDQKLAALDALKKSLLHQAIAGELTCELHQSKIIPFPVAVPGTTTTDLHAGILAMAYRSHEQHGKQARFGHVKAEKISHLVEALVGIDLGRMPVKDAAGPNDFPHLQKVEHRAKKAGYFLFQRVGEAYRVTKYRRFDELLVRTESVLGERRAEVDRLLELMRPMSSQQAEVFATAFAAWNNLLLDGELISDERIVQEARENWHPDKMKIPREKFFGAIAWIREKGICPEGKGKKVLSKAAKKRR